MSMLEAGAPFGAYTIEGFIAAGGMGEVYAARHAVYGSPVALKVLHAALVQDADWRRRFNEEGLVGQQLKHPHVLAARELVEADGRVALVMDLVRGGQTLSRVLSREFATGLPLVQALQGFLAVLQGVEYLHGKAVVHGDIKPENVMIQGEFRDPSTWVPLVTDFGTVGLIAHPVLIDGQPAVVASPRYASPEHLYGVDRVEVRSDIYSLGLLLHYLLTGRHASEARTVQEAADVVARPIPLVHLVDQPAAVMALIQRATAVSPDDRYATCREMALAIRTTLDELGVKLQLEDLQADLATEVMEERARMKRDQAARNAESPDGDESGSGDTASADDATVAAEDQDTELDLEGPGSPPPPKGVVSGQEAQMQGTDGGGRPPKDDAARPSGPPEDDEDAPAVPKNPLWGAMGAVEDDDLSEAPTARLTPGAPRDSDATVKLPLPPEPSPSPAVVVESPKPPPAPVQAPARQAEASGGMPAWIWLAVGAVIVVAILVASLVLT